MSSELIEALRMLAEEKNVDELVLLESLEQELAKSYKKILKLDWEANVTIDRENGRIYVYEMEGVGEEDPETGNYESYTPHDVTPDDVSRLVAQSAKKVINEIVRDAERASIYREFAGRKGELITGTVLQSTPDFTTIKIRDGIEAELPHYDKRRGDNVRNERPANERYSHNQRLKALIIDVRDPSADERGATGRSEGSNRASIIVSRTHPDLIRRLLELEVPEIYDGVVEVKAIAREAGARSKIAVSSREPRLDPVGACVGPKGSRIRMVVNELGAERIDVIQWDEDAATFVANALSPAKVKNVYFSEGTRSATVIVDDDQLSLAIGKDGQNVRLAAHLTDCHIDIKSSSLFDGSGAGVESLVDDEDDAGQDDAPRRCEHVSGDVRCRNHARPGSRFCSLHADDEELESLI